MAFWTNNKNNIGRDPKRGFRFHIQITEVGGSGDGSYFWYAKTIDKPSFEIGTTEHDYLNHKFKFPGKTTWQPVTMKVVDPTNPDLAATFSDMITAAGYHPPSNQDDMTSVSKRLATLSVGDVIITQIDAMGKALEQWTLYNAWISKVSYGSLDYSSEDLTELEIEFQYDWASLESGTNGGSIYQNTGGADGSSDGKRFWFMGTPSTDPNDDPPSGP